MGTKHNVFQKKIKEQLLAWKGIYEVIMDGKIQNCAYLFERNETLVQLYKAHKAFPFDVSPASVHRYAYKGISIQGGHYRLETAVCGNKRFTSLEAIQRFLIVQQGKSTVVHNSESAPTSSGMTQSERKREMKRLGLRPQGESKPDKPKPGKSKLVD
jgi:hypothetical protein